MNKTISIIIPIYNAEQYLSKCLDSIIAQTFTSWEALLINDGSIDNSGAICDEYVATDSRFKSIHQENKGVSAARQAGLDNAEGEYIIHCDPDDWVEPNMLEEMIKCAQLQNADMVICDYIEESRNISNYISQCINNSLSAKDVQTKILKEELHGSCWNKLVKRSCLENIKFFPTDIYINEDALFNIRVLNKDINVYYLPKAYYHYNTSNNNSICHSCDTKVILSKMRVIAECEKFIDQKKFCGMFEMKRAVLISLFTAMQFKELANTYPEIHQTITSNNKRYHFHLPLSYFLAMALNGHPKLAYHCYTINIRLINWGKRLKKHLKGLIAKF